MERASKAEKEIGNQDPENPLPHNYPVGLDSLFTVSLITSRLFPAFWQGTPVRVIRSHWFYAPPASSASSSTNSSSSSDLTPSHLLKPFPVDPELSAALDHAYASIRPFEASYASEVASALKGGLEAQRKLAEPLGGLNESGVDLAAAGIEIIFENEAEGRIYSKGFLGSVSKSLWSSKSGLGGGQVVLRGWDAMRSYHKRKKEEAAKKGKTSTTASSQKLSTAGEYSDAESNNSPTQRSRTASSSSAQDPKKRAASTSSTRNAATANSAADGGSGFFALLKSKLGAGPLTGSAIADDEHQDETGEGKRANETQEAMNNGPRNDEGDQDSGAVGQVNELVLVCHGVGQKLAGTYESFSFIHAVNSFRTSCTTLSSSPSLAPLLNQQRAQFIPLLWRADISFDELDEEAADEHLGNKFSLADVEIKNSVPFLRQVVSGVVLDAFFYMSNQKDVMIRAVIKEANRIYRLFCARNPNFAVNGKVSIIAHSLGSSLAADILSNQQTFVKPLSELSLQEKTADTQFLFDTRLLILVGSPLAFFLNVGRGQLIARKGRARAKGVGKDIALDRAGRYGCMAIDAVYNIYHETDPVAFQLNAAVDREYALKIKPIAIPSTTRTLLQNFSDTYSTVTKMFDVSSLWGSSTTASGTGATAAKEGDSSSQDAKEKAKEVTPQDMKNAAQPAQNDDKDGTTPKARPTPSKRMTMKRLPSQMPGLSTKEFDRIDRAEKRFNALNPQGCVDFYLPAEGINQYLEALSSHGNYWHDTRVATFVLTQLFASSDTLEKTGRDEIGTEHEIEEGDEN